MSKDRKGGRRAFGKQEPQGSKFGGKRRDHV